MEQIPTEDFINKSDDEINKEIDKIKTRLGMKNKFTDEELQAAKEVRDFLIAENEPRLKSIYMAGEIVMWGEMRASPCALCEGKDKIIDEIIKDKDSEIKDWISKAQNWRSNTLHAAKEIDEKSKQIEELKAENERLKGLIDAAYIAGASSATKTLMIGAGNDDYKNDKAKSLTQFKTENNL